MSNQSELDEILANRCVFIGEGMPQTLTEDKRQMFALLGTPNEVIEAILNLIKKHELQARLDQIQRDFLQHSLNTDVDESLLIRIRDVQTEIVKQELESYE